MVKSNNNSAKKALLFRCRKNELDGEVFEVLFTLTDFTAFKEMFLDYRKVKRII